MRLLLDTHTFIWHQTGHSNLSSESRRTIGDPSNEVFLSIASVWEMAIKQGLGKLGLKTGVQTFVENGVRQGIQLLAVELPHVLAVQHLPSHHGDPFDRLLICQAKTEALTLVSRDVTLDMYGVTRLW